MVKYFAYGSNMSASVISDVCPTHKFLGPVKLKGYRLAFTRLSTKWGAGVADIVPAMDIVMWGVLYEVDESEIDNLDRKEGYRRAYTRITVDCVLQDKVIQEVMTYAIICKEDTEIRPSTEYLDTILEGAKQHELPDNYIRFLESLKRDDQWCKEGFLAFPTRLREEAGGLNLGKVSRRAAKRLGLRDLAAAVYGTRACLVKVARLDALDDNACQIDQTVRSVLGFPGRECYGTRVSIAPALGKGLSFPFVNPRALTLSLARPSLLHSEKRICVVHPDNLRLIGLNEGEYVQIRAVVPGRSGKYGVQKYTLRAFAASGRKLKVETGTSNYAKPSEIYLDLADRLRLGLPKDGVGTPVVVSADVWRLFASRLLYYGIALFLGWVAVTPMIQEIVSTLLGISRIVGLGLSLLLSAMIALVLSIFDLRGKVQY